MQTRRRQGAIPRDKVATEFWIRRDNAYLRFGIIHLPLFFWQALPPGPPLLASGSQAHLFIAGAALTLLVWFLRLSFPSASITAGALARKAVTVGVGGTAALLIFQLLFNIIRQLGIAGLDRRSAFTIVCAKFIV